MALNQEEQPVIDDNMTQIVTFSIQKIVLYSSCTTALGASLGALYGEIRGLSKLSYAFNMGANWTLIGVPFYTLREAILLYRKEIKAHNGESPWHRLGRDEFIASTLAGSIVGSRLGYMWRGYMAIPAGIIMYGGLAGLGQMGITSFRRWKQDVGYADWRRSVGLDHTTDSSVRDRWWRRQETFYRSKEDDNIVMPPSSYSWDPLRDGMDWASAKLNQYVTLPAWASPLANALDIEYRKKLNMQIQALEAQVFVLRKRVEEAKQKQQQASAI
ncbi:hypothetical protein SmJEL517_g03991 [Synchytrium microbalum]|uniref:Uncharacterized protein n=1 Tax=Synchytrium microbalum TaxID=1806994 RepID=A0A507C4P4_9FUNG|nr:uncharacterized protein SmJEL517_g03991 [Synchytrium microbalum]TPX32966.1 hypothetical protein SmJEL517_g03991 [Synchytrium microbalum]